LAAFCGLYQADDDGELTKVSINTEPLIENIRNTESVNSLRDVWMEIYKIANSDKTALRILEAEKDKRKKELEKGVKS
jgi:hypothetical protein